MADSKTGKKAAAAAAAMAQKEKKVISDEKYIENLRYDLANGLYVAQEGARALLRKYDEALHQIEVLMVANKELAEANKPVESEAVKRYKSADPELYR